MPKRSVDAVHVWYDVAAETEYSVSEVDADGAEIRCLGGWDDRMQAWDIGVEHAAEIGVPCIEINEAGVEVDRFDPKD